VLRSATISPVRYSAKCRRWHSLPKRSPYWARASCTTWGNSTIPGMSRCSILHLRQAKNGQNPFHLPHFYTVGREFAKDQKDLIEEALFARRRDLFTQLQLVFFDTTSIYFEGQGGETIGQ